MTSSDGPEGEAYVLRVSAVQSAISLLKTRKIHEAFVAYLCLTRSAGRRTADGAQKVTSGLEGDWSGDGEVARWLAVPGGPPGKPHFRPFVSRGSNEENFWMNRNLAGSYAPASLRGQVRALLLGPSPYYRLPTTSSGDIDAARLATVLVKDEPVPAWAMGAYLFRNRSFDSDDGIPTTDDLLEIFADYFYLTPAEEGLFDWDPTGLGPLFEPFTEDVTDE